MARRKPAPQASDTQASDTQAPDTQTRVRETAYFLWEQEGRPHGQDREHWERARAAAGRVREEAPMEDEEKILEGRLDVNFPALLTRDVPGG